MNEREGCMREDQDLQPNQAVTTLYLTSAKPWKNPNSSCSKNLSTLTCQ